MSARMYFSSVCIVGEINRLQCIYFILLNLILEIKKNIILVSNQNLGIYALYCLLYIWIYLELLIEEVNELRREKYYWFCRRVNYTVIVINFSLFHIIHNNNKMNILCGR